MKNEVTIKARALMPNAVVTVRLTGLRRATWMLRLGALFIRFGCWLANLGYVEEKS